MAKVSHVSFPNLVSVALHKTEREFRASVKESRRLLTFYDFSANGAPSADALSDRVTQIRYAEQAEEAEGQLGYLITHQDEFKRLFQETEASVLEVLSGIQLDEAFTEKLEAAREEASEFLDFAGTVTITHLALEEHFTSFCRGYSTPQRIVSEKFLLPLVDLRNNYFRSPSLRTLEVYIAMVENMTADFARKGEFNEPTEAREYRRRARKDAADKLVTLEVAVMFYELESPVQDNSFPMTNG